MYKGCSSPCCSEKDRVQHHLHDYHQHHHHHHLLKRYIRVVVPPVAQRKGDRRQLPRGKPSTAPYLQNTKILYKEPPIFLVVLVNCTIFCPYGIPLNQLRSTHLEEMQMLPNMPHFYFYTNFIWRMVYQIKFIVFARFVEN